MSGPPSGFRLPGWAVAPQRAPTLIVQKEGQEVQRILLSDKALLFGRKVPDAPARGTLRLEHDSISREHAVIVHAFSGETFVCDLTSRYGTKLDGEPLKPRAYTTLKDGQLLQFGESTRRFGFYRNPPPKATESVAPQMSSRKSAPHSLSLIHI